MSLRVDYDASLSVDCDPPTLESIHELVRRQLAISDSKPPPPATFVGVHLSDEARRRFPDIRVKYYAGLIDYCDQPTLDRIHDVVPSQLAIVEPKPAAPTRCVSAHLSKEYMPARSRWVLWFWWMFWGPAVVICNGVVVIVLHAGVKCREWLSAWSE